MEEIVLKRIANITSAQALDEISNAHPGSEVLSFRKIKEAGVDNEFFIARIKVAAMADEPDDVVIDSEDVVIEDKQHEDEEERKMDKIVELLTEVLGELKSESESADEGFDEMQMQMEDMPTEQTDVPNPEDGALAKLPQQVSPPTGSGMAMARLVVARDADVSAEEAKLELIREFSSQGYRISAMLLDGDKYFVDLQKVSETGGQKRIKKQKEKERGPGRQKYPSGSQQAAYQEYPYVGNRRERKRQIADLMADRNGGQEWPRPKKPATKDPQALREYKKELQRWEEEYEKADNYLDVPSWMESYLDVFYTAMESDNSMPDAIRMTDEEFQKLRNFPTPEDALAYTQSREQREKLLPGLKKEKAERMGPLPRKNPRGEITQEGWQALMEQGDPTAEYTPEPMADPEADPRSEVMLLSRISDKPAKGATSSPRQMLVERRMSWKDPAEYARRRYAERISEVRNKMRENPDDPSWQEALAKWEGEQEQLEEYLIKNVEQNKRSYYDALKAAIRFPDPSDQANFLMNYQYSEGKPSVMPSGIPTGISPRTSPPGSIERQQGLAFPSKLPEPEKGSTPMSIFDRVQNRLKMMQQGQQQQAPVEPQEQEEVPNK